MMDAAPFYSDLAEGPENGTASWVRTADDMRLRIAQWATSTDSKGTVFLFPGRTGYAERWGRIAGELNRLGYSSLVIDWRGHGLSDRITDDRRLCHVNRFSDYQLDVAAMLEAAKEQDLPKPWFLIGNSLGACIGLRALIEGFPASACAFIAPMWGITFSPVQRPLAWLLSWGAQAVGRGRVYAPGQNEHAYVLRSSIDDNTMTHDADMFEYWAKQAKSQPDLLLGGVSFGWLYQALSETRALSKLGSPSVPCLAYCGDQDEDVELNAIQRRMANWANGRFDLVRNCKHDILGEVPDIRNKVMSEIGELFASSHHSSN